MNQQMPPPDLQRPDSTAPTRLWLDPGASRIPYWAYTDPAIYQRELQHFFYGPHWCYVGLEAEIPKAGDYRLSRIGERSVIVVDRKSVV